MLRQSLHNLFLLQGHFLCLCPSPIWQPERPFTGSFTNTPPGKRLHASVNAAASSENALYNHLSSRQIHYHVSKSGLRHKFIRSFICLILIEHLISVLGFKALKNKVMKKQIHIFLLSSTLVPSSTDHSLNCVFNITSDYDFYSTGSSLFTIIWLYVGDLSEFVN